MEVPSTTLWRLHLVQAGEAMRRKNLEHGLEGTSSHCLEREKRLG